MAGWEFVAARVASVGMNPGPWPPLVRAVLGSDGGIDDHVVVIACVHGRHSGPLLLAGRVTRVVYLDANGVEQAQATKAVVLAANGAETPRLLFLSASSQHPDGLANSSGLVGKNLIFNGYSQTWAEFPEPLNEYKSIVATRVVMDFYDSDPQRGFYGGGGIDARATPGPLFWGVVDSPIPGAPTWGSGFKAQLRKYVYTMAAAGQALAFRAADHITAMAQAGDL